MVGVFTASGFVNSASDSATAIQRALSRDIAGVRDGGTEYLNIYSEPEVRVGDSTHSAARFDPFGALGPTNLLRFDLASWSSINIVFLHKHVLFVENNYKHLQSQHLYQ